jgi:hypothetical protein
MYQDRFKLVFTEAAGSPPEAVRPITQ